MQLQPASCVRCILPRNRLHCVKAVQLLRAADAFWQSALPRLSGSLPHQSLSVQHCPWAAAPACSQALALHAQLQEHAA